MPPVDAVGASSSSLATISSTPAVNGPRRDNVVFEAGYFAQAKGKDRVRSVREQGAKMPADLGGDIYANLTDRANIASIKPVLKRFVEKNL